MLIKLDIANEARVASDPHSKVLSLFNCPDLHFSFAPDFVTLFNDKGLFDITSIGDETAIVRAEYTRRRACDSVF